MILKFVLYFVVFRRISGYFAVFRRISPCFAVFRRLLGVYTDRGRHTCLASWSYTPSGQASETKAQLVLVLVLVECWVKKPSYKCPYPTCS